jgi:hypothetical protein
MSLAERLSALEDYEHLRDPSPVGSQRRKLSFNPIPRRWAPPEENPPPIPAFEVSQAKRIGTNCGSFHRKILNVSRPGGRGRHILSLWRGRRFWVCGYKTKYANGLLSRV